jgi:hypothetical protein
MLVIAHYPNGTSRDVTAKWPPAIYPTVAEVTPDGNLTGVRKGKQLHWCVTRKFVTVNITILEGGLVSSGRNTAM